MFPLMIVQRIPGHRFKRGSLFVFVLTRSFSDELCRVQHQKADASLDFTMYVAARNAERKSCSRNVLQAYYRYRLSEFVFLLDLGWLM